MDGIGGTLCRDVLDEGPEPCNFGLAMETSAGDVRAHPSGERKRPVSSRPDETPNRKDDCDVNTDPKDTRRLRFGLG